MSFDVAADAYDRFMGRYSAQLAPGLADLGGVQAGQTVLDVGCGPGALTAELVRRLGPDAVAAVDPSESFVAAARARHPGVDVRLSAAEDLPYPDGTFDAAFAQLVVHFMTDPVAGLAEMARVTRADGVVAACVWDLAGGRAPPVSGRRLASSIVAPRTNLAWPVRVQVISPSCSRRRGCDALKKLRSPRLSITRASTSGGGRSRLVWDRQAHTHKLLTKLNYQPSASAAGGCCQKRPLR